MKARENMEKKEASRRRRRATETLWIIIAGVVLFSLIWAAFCKSLREDIDHAGAADVIGYVEFYGVEEPADGVGRVSNATEMHGNPAACVATHGDALNYNLNTTLWGWDGHGMEVWEMDLFARIAYLEFWGTSPECCEAGVDSVLRLWESGYFSDSLGGTLSAQNEGGGWVYSTYAYVWDWQYDAAGLADMKALCVERFTAGPEWSAPFFQLGGYPAWACPMYQVDGVYFSTGWGW